MTTQISYIEVVNRSASPSENVYPNATTLWLGQLLQDALPSAGVPIESKKPLRSMPTVKPHRFSILCRYLHPLP